MKTTALHRTLKHNLGTFHGFNFRDHGPIERELTDEDVAWWDHEANGEAEFWPNGDHLGVKTVCSGGASITAMELRALDRLLTDLGDDSETAFLRIHYARSVLGLSLCKLTAMEVEAQNVQVFTGSSFREVRKEAAYELFSTFFTEQFKFWNTDPHAILTFDRDRFLDAPFWSVHEVDLGERKVLLVAPA
jgi:hypothetical protein